MNIFISCNFQSQLNIVKSKFNYYNFFQIIHGNRVKIIHPVKNNDNNNYDNNNNNYSNNIDKRNVKSPKILSGSRDSG